MFIKNLIIIISILLVYSCGNDDLKENQEKELSDDNVEDVVEDSTVITKRISKTEDTVRITNQALIRTSMGNILIGLYGDDAPKTVENFLGLVRKGYYNGILIHRVAKNFVIQMGDRNTINKRKKDDWGKGGQSYFGEPFEDELNMKAISYRKGYQLGVVAMANRAPNTNTSQFFICLDEAVELERKWTIFGRVIEGMEIVREISEVDVIPGKLEPNDGLPIKPIKIYSIRIRK